MRKFLKWATRILAVLLLAAAVLGFWKREEITRLLAVNSLFDADRIVANFSHMDSAFLTVDVPRGDGPVTALPAGDPMTLPEGTDNWITDHALTSLLVMHKGNIVHENYYLGTKPEDRRISWSMAKSYLSALLGVVMADGHIASLDDPATKYAPLLKGSAYDGASVLNVLQMTSGIEFDEDYLDYNSDINRMGRVLALGGSMDGFAASMDTRAAPAGEAWKYVSIDTHVLGMIIRGATGRDIPSLLSEKIIAPLGQEAAPFYLSDGNGVAFVLGGLNITTRDYARFGQMFLQGGAFNGVQIVPADWAAASTKPSAPTGPDDGGYGYQWWIPKGAPDGVFYARGIYGQYIYIDQNRDVVIVVTSANKAFRDPGVFDKDMTMLAQIAGAL